MRLLGTMLPAVLLAGLPTAAALAQDAPAASGPAGGAATPGTPSGATTAPAVTAPVDINQPIGATPPPDINRPIGADTKADINQPVGVTPATPAPAAAEQPVTPVFGAVPQPVLAGGTEMPAVGGSQGYGSPFFNVDSRTNVPSTGGAFFGGLPIPALGYSLSANLLSVYQTNMLGLPADRPPPDGYSKSDFSVAPLIAGSANIPLGRQQIYLSGNIGKTFYANNTSYDRGRFLFAGGLGLSYGPSCHANLDANWAQAQSAKGASAIYVPNTLTTTSFGASTGCSLASGIQGSVSYRYSQGRNSNNDPSGISYSAFNDLNNSNVIVSLGYARASLGTISLFASKSFNTYPNRTVTLGQQTFTQGINVTNLGVSYQRGLGVRLTIDGSLFWVNSVPQDSFQPSNSSLGYSLNLNYRPTSRMGFSVNGSSNSSASPSNTSLYYLSRSFGVQFTYNVRPSLNLGLSAITSYQDNKGLGSDIPGAIKSSRLNTYRAALNWSAPAGRLNASLYLLQQNRSSNPAFYDYGDTSIGLSLSYRI